MQPLNTRQLRSYTTPLLLLCVIQARRGTVATGFGEKRIKVLNEHQILVLSIPYGTMILNEHQILVLSIPYGTMILNEHQVLVLSILYGTMILNGHNNSL